MAEFSILLPHKHDRDNDQALRIALDCIASSTHHDYELIIDTTTPADPYIIYNQLARRASCEYVVMTNSDVFFAPGWDIPMVEAAAVDTIITGVLVEPGCIGCPPVNIRHDFGMRPDTYRRAAFEYFATCDPALPDGDGWYMPCMINRNSFLALGGFDTRRGRFQEEPLDKFFWEAWREAGLKVQRVKSYAYHLQNWSNPVERKRAMRYEFR